MKFKFMVAATLMAALVTITSCGNSNNKQSQSEKTGQAAPEVLSVDNLVLMRKRRRFCLEASWG